MRRLPCAGMLPRLGGGCRGARRDLGRYHARGAQLAPLSPTRDGQRRARRATTPAASPACGLMSRRADLGARTAAAAASTATESARAMATLAMRRDTGGDGPRSPPALAPRPLRGTVLGHAALTDHGHGFRAVQGARPSARQPSKVMSLTRTWGWKCSRHSGRWLAGP